MNNIHTVKKYYIASCLFTARFPETSLKIQNYIRTKSDIDIVRCCIPNYKVQFNTERIPENKTQNAWQNLPVTADFQPKDTVYSVCHNCTNIVSECYPDVNVVSLWELIDDDDKFVYPDYSGLKVTLQDCWRTRERKKEQNAVRSLLRKMNIEYIEIAENRMNTNFCGSTLYRSQPAKNPKYAPKHYIEQAKGKFLPHTPAEQIAIMQKYCKQYTTKTVVCYCHYCLEGLLQGNVDGRHIADLLFPQNAKKRQL